MTPPGRRLSLPLPLQAAIVLAVCAVVYWPMLGSSGLTSTEGHRVIPGWTMLQTGQWWRVEMFDLGYLRKPPGMPWAVALSSSIFGQTEFAARAVSAMSATLMALLAFLFATRWFGGRGRPWGLGAGIGCALLPLFWSSGRSAEIEALNNLATLAAAGLLIESLLPRVRAEGARGAPGPCRALVPRPVEVLAAGAIVLVALAKGPASAPILLAVPIAASIARRSLRPACGSHELLWRGGAIWRIILLAGAALIIIGRQVLAATGEPETVRQGVSEFLWSADRAAAILTLLPVALAFALPASLAVLFPFGPDAQREARRAAAEGSHDDVRAVLIARTLAWAWILALACFTLLGISNPRYATPAAVLLPPLLAYAWRGWRSDADDPLAFVPRRRLAARIAFLGHPGVLAAGLLVAAVIYVPMSERTRAEQSGHAAGQAVAAAIMADLGTGGTRNAMAAPPRAILWADDMIETRPEVLLYAARMAAEHGLELRPLWRKHEMLRGGLPAAHDADGAGPPAAYILLKTDEDSQEPARFAALIRGEAPRLVRLAGGRVHKFEYTLYRVEAGSRHARP